MALPIEQLDKLMEEPEVVSEGFVITNLKLAIWADERVRDAEVKMREIDTLADERVAVLQAKIDKLNEWRDEAKKPLVGTVEFFKGHLMRYLLSQIRQQVDAGLKKVEKSIKLPFRTLQAKSQQPEIVKEDAALLEWASANAAEYVETKPVLKWAELKKSLTMTNVNGDLVYVDQNGEIVPGIKLIERGDVLDWKVKENE